MGRLKAEALGRLLADAGSVVVAFSGGVDSAYLASVAHHVLGDRALAVTGESPSYPARHRELALTVAKHVGFRHEFITTHEMSVAAYRDNGTDRCYHCKHELHSRLTALARDRGYAWVVDGNNADDRTDHRPGRRAARELGVRSPLDEVGLTKSEIRELAREAGVPTWDEPASACLSSRIPYRTEVTPERLQEVERAEEALHALGFRVCRVRHHGEVARVELTRDDMIRALDPEVSRVIVDTLRAIGFSFVSIDLEGYRRGSLNEPLRLLPV